MLMTTTMRKMDRSETWSQVITRNTIICKLKDNSHVMAAQCHNTDGRFLTSFTVGNDAGVNDIEHKFREQNERNERRGRGRNTCERFLPHHRSLNICQRKYEFLGLFYRVASMFFVSFFWQATQWNGDHLEVAARNQKDVDITVDQEMTDDNVLPKVMPTWQSVGITMTTTTTTTYARMKLDLYPFNVMGDS